MSTEARAQKSLSWLRYAQQDLAHARSLLFESMDELRSFVAAHGTLPGMKTTIDAAGRLVVPKEIRRQAGLQPGMPLDVRWRDGRIEIEPLPIPIALVREGRFLVAVFQGEIPVLTSQDVEETRDALAYEHERGL